LFKLTLAQKLGSYIVPVRVWKGSSAENPVLELFYFRGEWQLGTEDALYSDGTRYRPLTEGFSQVKDELGNMKKILMLGAGLGSAATILDKMGYHPEFTLIDIDEVVLEWTAQLLPSQLLTSCQLVASSADRFIKDTPHTWDLIIIDIFKGRSIPSFVSSEEFLTDCKQHLAPNGHLIANYMVNNQTEWETFFPTFSTVFQQVNVTELGINRVLVAKV